MEPHQPLDFPESIETALGQRPELSLVTVDNRTVETPESIVLFPKRTVH
jgi:hypothetical protein